MNLILYQLDAVKCKHSYTGIELSFCEPPFSLIHVLVDGHAAELETPQLPQIDELYPVCSRTTLCPEDPFISTS